MFRMLFPFKFSIISFFPNSLFTSFHLISFFSCFYSFYSFIRLSLFKLLTVKEKKDDVVIAGKVRLLCRITRKLFTFPCFSNFSISISYYNLIFSLPFFYCPSLFFDSYNIETINLKKYLNYVKQSMRFYVNKIQIILSIFFNVSRSLIFFFLQKKRDRSLQNYKSKSIIEKDGQNLKKRKCCLISRNISFKSYKKKEINNNEVKKVKIFNDIDNRIVQHFGNFHSSKYNNDLFFCFPFFFVKKKYKFLQENKVELANLKKSLKNKNENKKNIKKENDKYKHNKKSMITPEIAFLVCFYLNVEEICRFSLVSKSIYYICTYQHQPTWQELVLKKYGFKYENYVLYTGLNNWKYMYAQANSFVKNMKNGNNKEKKIENILLSSANNYEGSLAMTADCKFLLWENGEYIQCINIEEGKEVYRINVKSPRTKNSKPCLVNTKTKIFLHLNKIIYVFNLFNGDFIQTLNIREIDSNNQNFESNDFSLDVSIRNEQLTFLTLNALYVFNCNTLEFLYKVMHKEVITTSGTSFDEIDFLWAGYRCVSGNKNRRSNKENFNFQKSCSNHVNYFISTSKNSICGAREHCQKQEDYEISCCNCLKEGLQIFTCRHKSKHIVTWLKKRSTTIKIFDMKDGKEIYELVGHDYKIFRARQAQNVFKLDDYYLASLDVGGIIRIWDSSTKNFDCLQVLKTDNLHTFRLSFTSTHLMTMSELRPSRKVVIKLWKFNPTEKFEKAVNRKNSDCGSTCTRANNLCSRINTSQASDNCTIEDNANNVRNGNNDCSNMCYVHNLHNINCEENHCYVSLICARSYLFDKTCMKAKDLSNYQCYCHSSFSSNRKTMAKQNLSILKSKQESKCKSFSFNSNHECGYSNASSYFVKLSRRNIHEKKVAKPAPKNNNSHEVMSTFSDSSFSSSLSFFNKKKQEKKQKKLTYMSKYIQDYSQEGKSAYLTDLEEMKRTKLYVEVDSSYVRPEMENTTFYSSSFSLRKKKIKGKGEIRCKNCNDEDKYVAPFISCVSNERNKKMLGSKLLKKETQMFNVYTEGCDSLNKNFSFASLSSLFCTKEKEKQYERKQECFLREFNHCNLLKEINTFVLPNASYFSDFIDNQLLGVWLSIVRPFSYFTSTLSDWKVYDCLKYTPLAIYPNNFVSSLTCFYHSSCFLSHLSSSTSSPNSSFPSISPVSFSSSCSSFSSCVHNAENLQSQYLFEAPQMTSSCTNISSVAYNNNSSMNYNNNGRSDTFLSLHSSQCCSCSSLSHSSSPVSTPSSSSCSILSSSFSSCFVKLKNNEKWRIEGRGDVWTLLDWKCLAIHSNGDIIVHDFSNNLNHSSFCSS